MDPVDTFKHNGCTVEIFIDDDSGSSNPRENDGCIATLIQENSRLLDVDDDDAGLGEARDRFDCYGRRGTSAHGYAHGTKVPLDREAMMKRYLAMFRPDILHYDDWLTVGSGRAGYGWGYVTREAWEKWMGTDYDGDVTPEQAFDGEVTVYNQWADGEVYGYVITRKGREVGSCWGFIGEEWAEQTARDEAGYTCKHCQRSIKRWVGPVIDTKPEGSLGFAHDVCETCHAPVKWGKRRNWWRHLDRLLDRAHVATISHAHQCAGGEHFAETDQTVRTP